MSFWSSVKKIGKSLAEPLISLGGDLLGAHSSAKKSAKQAQKQMDFQERMSNTSYQRAVNDLQAAGLNPMLAYSQGGASTPSGAAGDVPDQSKIGSNTMANYATAQQVKNVQANTQKAIAETQLTQERVQQEKMNTDWQKGQWMAGNPDRQAELDKLREAANQARAQSDITNTESRIKRIEERILQETSGSTIASAASTAALRDKEVSYQEIQNILARLKLPEAEAMAKWFDTVGAGSPAVKAIMSVSQWLKFIFR